MPTTNPRFCITVSEDMLKAIDDYRFENRIGSRSQATIQLIELGLKALAKQEEQAQK